MISSVNDKLRTISSINEKYTINNRNHLLLYIWVFLILLYFNNSFV